MDFAGILEFASLSAPTAPITWRHLFGKKFFVFFAAPHHLYSESQKRLLCSGQTRRKAGAQSFKANFRENKLVGLPKVRGRQPKVGWIVSFPEKDPPDKGKPTERRGRKASRLTSGPPSIGSALCQSGCSEAHASGSPFVFESLYSQTRRSHEGPVWSDLDLSAPDTTGAEKTKVLTRPWRMYD